MSSVITHGPGLSNSIRNVRQSAHANQIFAENADTVTTASFEEIFSYTSTDNETRITFLECSASTFGQYRVKVDGAIKRELYTTGSQPNAIFVFPEPRTLANAEEITVEFRAYRILPGIASHSTFVAMDGYIGP